MQNLFAAKRFRVSGRHDCRLVSSSSARRRKRPVRRFAVDGKSRRTGKNRLRRERAPTGASPMGGTPGVAVATAARVARIIEPTKVGILATRLALPEEPNPPGNSCRRKPRRLVEKNYHDCDRAPWPARPWDRADTPLHCDATAKPGVCRGDWPLAKRSGIMFSLTDSIGLESLPPSQSPREQGNGARAKQCNGRRFGNRENHAEQAI